MFTSLVLSLALVHYVGLRRLQSSTLNASECGHHSAGQTVVQVVTLGVDGLPTTSIVSVSLSPSYYPSNLSVQQTVVGALTRHNIHIHIHSHCHSNNDNHLPQQQGPVGQPAPTVGTPGGPTPFTYTTTIGGETIVTTDVFTPSTPATTPHTPTAEGTIWDYSQWLSQYAAAQPTGSSGNHATATAPPSRAKRPSYTRTVMNQPPPSTNRRNSTPKTHNSRTSPAHRRPRRLLPRPRRRMGPARRRVPLSHAQGPHTGPGGGTAKEPVKPPPSARPPRHQAVLHRAPILRDLQLEPYKLGIGQHPAAAHGLAALEGFVAAIELLDLIRECIPSRTTSPPHLPLAAATRTTRRRPLERRHHPRRRRLGPLPTELRKRNIHLSTICVGKLAEFADCTSRCVLPPPIWAMILPWIGHAGERRDAPVVPHPPAHQVLISGLSAHPTHPAQLTHPTQPTQPAHPNQQPNQPNQPAQTIQSAYPAQATQLPQQNHPPAHLPTQPPYPTNLHNLKHQPFQRQEHHKQQEHQHHRNEYATHAKRTHELAQTERPQADVKRAKPSPEKSSPMVAPAVPPVLPVRLPMRLLTLYLHNGAAVGSPGAWPSATTAPPTTTTTPAPVHHQHLPLHPPAPQSTPQPSRSPRGPLAAAVRALPPPPGGEAALDQGEARRAGARRGGGGRRRGRGLKKQFEQTGRNWWRFQSL
ncbi:hypothetical protein IMY05_C4504000400 [Salix suchowensis]|nr:hypothetical protein IMY05_C4504000400 [Salix suchowensis]